MRDLLIRKAISATRQSDLESELDPVSEKKEPQVVELHVLQDHPQDVKDEVESIRQTCEQIATSCEELRTAHAELKSEIESVSQSLASVREYQNNIKEPIPPPDRSEYDARIKSQIDSCVDGITKQSVMADRLMQRLDSIEKILSKPTLPIPEPPTYEMEVVGRDVNQRTQKIRLTPRKE